MKFYQYGRSMVEMLGVLAIIGVLSVGSISGYNKAMMKYKLNKHTQQLNQIFNTAAQYVGQFSFNNSSYNLIIEPLAKLNLIPDEMLRGNYSAIYDIFNNRMYIYAVGNQQTNAQYKNAAAVEARLQGNTGDNVASCRNIIITAKENRAILWRIETNSGTPITYFGDGYCSSNVKCINDLTLTKIDDMCRSASDEQFVFRVWFR